MGDVEHLPHLGVDGRVLGIGPRADAGELAGRERVLRREQGDVDAARHQRLGQQARHQLPRAVVARRRAPGDRRQHGDTHAMRPSRVGRSTVRMTPSSARSSSAPSAAGAASATVERSGRRTVRPVRQRQALRPSAEIERHEQSLVAVPTLVGEHVALARRAARSRRSTAPDARAGAPAAGDRASSIECGSSAIRATLRVGQSALSGSHGVAGGEAGIRARVPRHRRAHRIAARGRDRARAARAGPAPAPAGSRRRSMPSSSP